MNDERFLELLNLYLDQQIGASDAAELEKEVLRNPERRRTYREYCRLQRACSLLVESSQTHSAGATAFVRSLQDAERKMSAPRRRTIWKPTLVYAGSFGAAAMAACVAVVLLLGQRNASDASARALAASGSDVQTNSFSAPAPSTLLASLPTAEVEFGAPTVLTPAVLGVARTAREAEIAANDREALEWMQRVELLPSQRLEIDESAFDAARATLHPDNRVFRSRRGLQQGNAEFTAFQFQR